MWWFRFYTEALDDPKVQRLQPASFKGWVNILCIASKHDGILPSTEDIAFLLRVEIETATNLLEDLERAGLLERKGNSLVPHGWNRRQYKSDVSNERVERYRKRKRNVTVTPPDTDTDTEIDIVHSNFDQAWGKWPRKQQKKPALKAFQKALKKTTIETILANIKTYVETKPEYEDYCLFATWLNKERWNDDRHTDAAKHPTNGTGDEPEDYRTAAERQFDEAHMDARAQGKDPPKPADFGLPTANAE